MSYHWTEIALDKDNSEMERESNSGSVEALAPAMKRSGGFWNRRTGLEKALLAVVGVCGLAMVAGGSYYAVQNSNNTIPADSLSTPTVTKKEGNQEFEVCTTPECALAAARIISSMDLTADPCQDFFQYACGQWIEDNPIPDSESRWGTFDALDGEVQKAVRKAIEAEVTDSDAKAVVYAKDMYKACNDLETIEAAGYAKFLSMALDSMGGWPMIQSTWNRTEFSWETFSGLARRTHNLGLILSPYVFMDSFDVTQNVIHVDQASLALPRDFYVDETGAYEEYTNAYKDYIFEVAQVLTREAGFNVPESALRQSAEEIFLFESVLARFTVPDEDRRNTTEMYNPMTVAQLKQTYPFNWDTYFAHLFGDTDIEIDDTERVIVIEPEYLEALLVALNASPIRLQADYLFWRLIMDNTAYGPAELTDIQFKFTSKLYGLSSKPPRWSSCMSLVQNDYRGFGFAVAHEYIKENFNEEAKQEADEMVNNLRTAFKELVGESLWMDADTQVLAKEKADLMKQLLGYPSYVLNPDELDVFYGGVGEPTATTHLENVLKAISFMSKKELDTLRQAPDREFWFMNPATVNAWYSPNHNSITFPAAILHPPFFRQGNPKYLNYGAIGVVIGHEITHGFDDQGRQYDGIGNAFPWWSEATIEAFTEQANCFIEMYDNYTVPELIPTLGEDAHLNGFNTQGENIADNGGLRESFRAYKNFVASSGEEARLPGLTQFSPEQLFFVGYAQVWCQSITDAGLLNQVLSDPHSPARYRVLGPLSNSNDFIDNFQCPPGTPLNRDKKCLLW